MENNVTKAASNPQDQDENISDEETRESSGTEDYGFQPDEQVVNSGKKDKEKKEEDEKTKKERVYLIHEISRIIARNPSISLKSTYEQLAHLANVSIEELRNFYDNAVTDLITIKGTPGAEFLVGLTTHYIDRELLPGLQEECLEDEELLRDVDSLVSHYLGHASTAANILFRVANNAANVSNGRKRRKRKEPEANQEEGEQAKPSNKRTRPSN